MMTDFNSYLNNLDFSHIKDLFAEKGKLRTYRKNEYFLWQQEPSRMAGWVESGIFQYTYTDEVGVEHIVGFSFAEEYICDYASLMKGSLSQISVQAITDCAVYEISRQDLIEYWETNMDTQRFGRQVTENLFEMTYARFLDSYCTPEIRYRKLMKRCSDLKEMIPLKKIASYLGVTPETISHIRKKLNE